MKLFMLLGVVLLLILGVFHLIQSLGGFGLNDWRLEMLLTLVLIGIPAGMAARAM